ncbi:MAG TPA: PQQ-binding-like beta-propeller repeat protein [Planctomycetota bacterium]|nr:PQQ-binding-like beta-propeller repeat protein [Planctomycetota bacterium]
MWCSLLMALVPLTGFTQDGVASEQTVNWPGWRGPLGNGSAPSADPPLSWSEDKNVRWKTALPGAGHGSPVVWGQRIFVTAAIPVGEEAPPVPDDAPGAHDNAPLTRKQRFVALCLDRETGEILWQQTAREVLPHAGAHVSGTLASSSPVVDGEVFVAHFGSNGLFGYTHDGKLLWSRDLGQMQVKHGHGEGSSPVLHGGTLVVNWDHEGASFVVALNRSNGEELWRAERDEVTSWASPAIAQVGKTTQVIVSGTNRARGYDLKTGKQVWECGGLSNNVVASPVVGHGMAVLGSSYEKKSLIAIDLEGASGDLTGGEHVAWTRKRGTPYVPSPLLHGHWVYYLSHYQGVLSRVHVQTGSEPAGPFRLEGMYNIYSSPVAAAGRVYITDRDGATLVLSHTDGNPEVLAVNRLDDSFSASAALVGRDLLLRGERHLYCLSEESAGKVAGGR